MSGVAFFDSSFTFSGRSRDQVRFPQTPESATISSQGRTGSAAMNAGPNRFLAGVCRQPVKAGLLLLGVLMVCVLGAHLQARRVVYDRTVLLFERRVEAYQYQLSLLRERPMAVLDVLAMSKELQSLLAQPSEGRAREINTVLQQTAEDLHLDVVYLMDRKGDVIASSNWRQPDAFAGRNYAFRPYFTQAMSGQHGRFVGKGVTSQQVGMYFAHPLRVDGETLGVIVVKTSIKELQAQLDKIWQRDGEVALLTDENGVIMMSPIAALNFKAVHPIPEAALLAMQRSHQYVDTILPAALTPGNSLGDGIRFFEFADLPGQTFLQKSYDFPDNGMRLYLALPAQYWQVVTFFTAMALLVAAVIFLAVIVVILGWAEGQRLIEAAIRDPLTGLNTRLYMEDWCNAAVRAHDRDASRSLSIIVFDLDNFKKVNDAYGHLSGDAVLRKMGEIIRNHIRAEDLAVRFGGEELAIFVRSASKAEALALAERIRICVENHAFMSDAAEWRVTLSGGVAEHQAGEPLDAMFARADEMLYQAKEQGRNRVCA